MLVVSSLDHLVLTVTDIDQSVAFYCDVLGMEAEQFHPADGSTRWALTFGVQKINLHPADGVFAPHAQVPQVGSADLCFLSETGLDDWSAHFDQQNIVVEEGPITRTGATGPIVSLYIRDPDGNLIEISNRS